MLGNNSLAKGVLVQIGQVLEHHEPIKVNIAAEERETKMLIAAVIVHESSTSKVQIIGNILVLYQARAVEWKIMLPR